MDGQENKKNPEKEKLIQAETAETGRVNAAFFILLCSSSVLRSFPSNYHVPRPTRWSPRCTWSTSRRWDPRSPSSSASYTAARAPPPLEQTSGSASGPMTPQPIRRRRMFKWGWGCTRRWALYKVRTPQETGNETLVPLGAHVCLVLRRHMN